MEDRMIVLVTNLLMFVLLIAKQQGLIDLKWWEIFLIAFAFLVVNHIGFALNNYLYGN